MGYLSETEIPVYCTLPGITMVDIENASLLIDAYKGTSFFARTYIEQSRLSKKRTPYGDVFKGKLLHMPRLSVDKIESYIPSPFGDEQLVEYNVDSIRFDDTDAGYYTFLHRKMPGPFASALPYQLIVSYTAGYTQDNIPETLKRVTAQLAQNLKRNGGTMKWVSRDDFDVKITLAKDGVFTTDLRQAVDMVRLS